MSNFQETILDADHRTIENWEINPHVITQNTWVGNPIICEEIYPYISDEKSSKHWLVWLMEDYFKEKKFNSMLSI